MQFRHSWFGSFHYLPSTRVCFSSRLFFLATVLLIKARRVYYTSSMFSGDFTGVTQDTGGGPLFFSFSATQDHQFYRGNGSAARISRSTTKSNFVHPRSLQTGVCGGIKTILHRRNLKKQES